MEIAEAIVEQGIPIENAKNQRVIGALKVAHRTKFLSRPSLETYQSIVATPFFSEKERKTILGELGSTHSIKHLAVQVKILCSEGLPEQAMSILKKYKFKSLMVDTVIEFLLHATPNLIAKDTPWLKTISSQCTIYCYKQLVEFTAEIIKGLEVGDNFIFDAATILDNLLKYFASNAIHNSPLPKFKICLSFAKVVSSPEEFKNLMYLLQQIQNQNQIYQTFVEHLVGQLDGKFQTVLYYAINTTDVISRWEDKLSDTKEKFDEFVNSIDLGMAILQLQSLDEYLEKLPKLKTTKHTKKKGVIRTTLLI